VRVSNATLGEGTFLSQERVVTSLGHSRAMVQLCDVGAVLDLAKVRAFAIAESRAVMKLLDVGAVLDIFKVRASCFSENRAATRLEMGPS
jgi:hypothetical protein